MGEQSKIEWTDDTHNFWQGCTKISPGCANCYAEARDKRFHGKSGVTHWGKGAPRVRSKSFDEPLRWNEKPWVCDCKVQAGTTKGKRYFSKDVAMAELEIRLGTFDCCECGRPVHRRRVFSLSIGDWLDDEVPIEWLADMLDVIRQCPNLDFLLLTKRLENWRKRLHSVALHNDLDDAARDERMYETREMARKWIEDGTHPENIWLGTSVENQEQADKRIPELLRIPANIRFLSMEPLLGPVNLRPLSTMGRNFMREGSSLPADAGIHWVIVGGESGLNARPCNVEWIRSIVQQCKSASVPCFVKQMGAFSIEEEGSQRRRILWNDKKGGDMAEWPEDLRVREFPHQ